MLIGFTFHRRGGDADFQGISQGARDLVMSRTRLDAELKNQVRTVPAIPCGGHKSAQVIAKIGDGCHKQNFEQLQHDQCYQRRKIDT